MLQSLTGIHLLVVFTYMSGAFSTDGCYFSITNEYKNICELSRWIDWNCTCCGSNVLDLALATRAKGICCPKYMNTAEDLEKCTRYCNVSTASLFDKALCGTYCTHVTHPSRCYVPATTSATQEAMAITTSSTPTLPTLITTSSSTTGQTPTLPTRITTTSSTTGQTPTLPTLITTTSSTTGQTPSSTTVTALHNKGNSPATSTPTKQTPSRKSTQISQPNATSRLTSQTTVSTTSGLLSSKTTKTTMASYFNKRDRFCVVGSWRFAVYENTIST